MAVSSARAAAFDILVRVEREHSFSSELLHTDRISLLSPEDRRLCTELVLGTLRWQSVLDNAIARQSSRGIAKLDLEILIPLRLGVYQMWFLERIPPHAAANESVELVKRARKHSAVGFANAILRKLAQHPLRSASAGATDDPRTIAAALSHPQWLVERWVKSFGSEAALAICNYDQQAPAATVRLPLEPSARAALEAELAADGVTLTPGTLVSCARTVAAGHIFSTRALLEGRLWIQDEGSQLVALLVGRGQRILDCCAAPGGKTAVLAERNPAAQVVALELHPHRARLLQSRVKAGNVEVRIGDATRSQAGPEYDRILADVPCSGTGTIARNPEIRWRLTPGDLPRLQKTQLSILQASLRQLSSGGRLVYATCSLEPEEGQEVIRKAVDGNPVRVVDCAGELQAMQQAGDLTAVDPASLCSGPYLRTMPGVHACDGFFAAILERTA